MPGDERRLAVRFFEGKPALFDRETGQLVWGQQEVELTVGCQSPLMTVNVRLVVEAESD